jgi:phosphate transport system substrate-binding protein
MHKLALLAAGVGMTFAAGVAKAADIAGAAFPFPIDAKWAEAHKAATGFGLNYQSIGPAPSPSSPT